MSKQFIDDVVLDADPADLDITMYDESAPLENQAHVQKDSVMESTATETVPTGKLVEQAPPKMQEKTEKKPSSAPIIFSKRKWEIQTWKKADQDLSKWDRIVSSVQRVQDHENLSDVAALDLLYEHMEVPAVAKYLDNMEKPATLNEAANWVRSKVTKKRGDVCGSYKDEMAKLSYKELESVTGVWGRLGSLTENYLSIERGEQCSIASYMKAHPDFREYMRKCFIQAFDDHPAMRREISRRCDFESATADEIRKAAESAEGQLEKEAKERTLVMKIEKREREEMGEQERVMPLCYYGRACKRRPKCPFEHPEGRDMDEDSREPKRTRMGHVQDNTSSLEAKLEMLLKRMDGPQNQRGKISLFGQEMEKVKDKKQTDSTPLKCNTMGKREAMPKETSREKDSQKVSGCVKKWSEGKVLKNVHRTLN